MRKKKNRKRKVNKKYNHQHHKHLNHNLSNRFNCNNNNHNQPSLLYKCNKFPHHNLRKNNSNLTLRDTARSSFMVYNTYQ